MEKRWLIYAIPIALALAGLGVGTYVALSTALIFAVVGINVSLTLDLVREQILKQKAKIRIVTNESTLVSLFELFKDRAVEECWLTWCTKYKVPDVNAYFRRERDFLQKRQGFRLRRIITPNEINWTRQDITNHLKDCDQLIAEGKYELRETHIKGAEIVYADYNYKGDTFRRALVVLNDKGRKVGFVFDENRSREQAACVNAVIALFECEWEAAKKSTSPASV